MRWPAELSTHSITSQQLAEGSHCRRNPVWRPDVRQRKRPARTGLFRQAMVARARQSRSPALRCAGASRPGQQPSPSQRRPTEADNSQGCPGIDKLQMTQIDQPGAYRSEARWPPARRRVSTRNHSRGTLGRAAPHPRRRPSAEHSRDSGPHQGRLRRRSAMTCGHP